MASLELRVIRVPLELPVSQVFLDLKAHQEIPEKVVFLALKEMLDETDWLVPLAMQAHEDLLAHLGRGDCLVYLAKKENEDLLGHQVHLAHKAHRVNWDLLD